MWSRWILRSTLNANCKDFALGTIHLRRWQIFTLFDPYPPYGRQFFSTNRRQIWQIFDPSPLEHADVLNGWSLNWKDSPQFSGT